MLTKINSRHILERFDAPFPSIFGQAPDELDSHLEILTKIGNYISSDDLVDIVSNRAEHVCW